MLRLDARGLSCPEPLLVMKKELEVTKEFELIVDSEVARENISRLLNTKKIPYEVMREGDDIIFRLGK